MSEQKELTIDEVLEHVGSCGLYQIRFVLLFCLICFAIILPLAEMPFLQAEPPWKCSTNSSVCNMTGVFRLGNQYYERRCSLERSQWEFVDDFTSIVTEFDLVCDKTFLASLTSSMLFLGWLLGALCGGVIADKFGRKFIMILNIFISSVISLISAFPTVYWLFTLLRFLLGFSIGCGVVPISVIIVEYVGIRHRHVACTCLWFSTGTATLLMPAMAYSIRDWRYLTIVTSVFGLPVIILFWFVPESARFLQLKGKTNETEKILRKIAVTNKSVYPDKPLVKYNKDGEESTMGNFKDLFRTRRMTQITLVSCFTWFVNALVYYGIIFSSPGLGSNMYISFALATLVSFPSNVICIYCLGKFGRKKTVVFSMIIASLFSIATVLLKMYDPGSDTGYETGTLITALTAMLFISVSFSGIYVYSAELFPTVVRNIGLGASTALARIGSFAAPFIINLNVVHVLLPYGIMGAFSLLAGILCWTLPETKSVPTAEVMNQRDANENAELAVIENDESKL